MARPPTKPRGQKKNLLLDKQGRFRTNSPAMSPKLSLAGIEAAKAAIDAGLGVHPEVLALGGTAAPEPKRRRVKENQRPDLPNVDVLTPEERAILETVHAAELTLARRQARGSLVEFTKRMKPDLSNPDDPLATRYIVKAHHKLIAEHIEKVVSGEILRLIVTMPPRMGKSELLSRRLPSWIMGNDPTKDVVIGCYAGELAQDFGRENRNAMQSDEYRRIFPEAALATSSVELITTQAGGQAVFVGRGGSVTGRGADIAVIDDPIKGRKEADSPTIRDDCWKWFNDDILSRLKDEFCAVIIVMTRWHEDDIVGRLLDPKSPHYHAEEAAQWTVLHLPALAEDNDPLGRQPGEALWPEKYSAEALQAMKRRNPRGFNALYQGRPTPEDGDHFKRDWIKTYSIAARPTGVRVYAASDHAVGLKQENDPTCLMIVGVDDAEDIWILDLFWRRASTDFVVDKMVDMMKRWKPITWWAEKGHISKSIGPFLKRRMREKRVYGTVVSEQTPAADKVTRSQSIRGRMEMGKVYLPRDAAWYQDAVDELLKFPRATHDDFVDALSHVGMGLDKVFGPGLKDGPREDPEPSSGTFAWIKWAASREKQFRRDGARRGGF